MIALLATAVLAVLPPQLTALRTGGLVLALAIIGFAFLRRHSLRNAEILILLLAGLGLLLVSGTEVTDRLLEALSFERGNGGRILGLAVLSLIHI